MTDREIQIMGIVNLNGDSFFSGSRILVPELVVERVGKMVEDGASIVDFGAVSTRPGAAPVSLEEEWERLEKPLDCVRREFPSLRISVDTFRSEIVRRCLSVAGRIIVNDISAGEDDPGMLPLVSAEDLTYVAMHKRGDPGTMQDLTDYPEGIVEAVLSYFDSFVERASGVSDWILDPGFGFAKTVSQNYTLLDGLSNFRRFGRKILVGVSRKSMIYSPLGITPDEALAPTQVVHLKALQEGADILRVHDVAEAARTVRLYREML